MNWDAVGAIGDVVGSIGVIVSLVYLAKQIGISTAQTEQNSKIVRGTAYQQFRIQVNSVLSLRVADRELAEIWEKGLIDHESLTGVDLVRFNTMIFMIVGNWESQFHLLRAGVFDESMGAGRTDLVASPGFRSWWAVRRNNYNAEFCAEIDRRLRGDA